MARNKTLLCLVPLIALLAYAASMPGTFQYDDEPTIVRNPHIREAGNFLGFFTDPSLFHENPKNKMYRPVLLVTYLANYLVAGYRPAFWHLTNVILHALNAFLVALLTMRLLSVFRGGRPPGWAPLLAGLAFALHPVHSEVANYISSRSGAVATAGFLGALLLHFAWTRGQHGAVLKVLLLVGSLACYGLGLGGKEIAVALPFVVLAVELLDPEPMRVTERLARALIRAAPLIVLTVCWWELRSILLASNDLPSVARFTEVEGRRDVYWGGGRTVLENLFTQARIFWRYLGLLLVPVGLAVDRFVRVSTSFSEPAVLVSVAGLVLLALLLLCCWKKAPLFTLLGAIFVFGLAPTSSLIPLNVLMNEHRLYLPGVAWAVLTGVALAALIRRRPRTGIAVAAVIGVCYVAVIVPRSLEWQDPAKLWASNVRVSPRSFRGHNQLGVAHLVTAAQGGFTEADLPLLDRAEASLLEAGRLYPNWYNANLNLGLVCRSRARITEADEDFQEAIDYFDRCRELSPGEWKARQLTAETYGFWKNYDEAIRLLAEMAAEDRKSPDEPRIPLYLYRMGKLELERGRPEAAEPLYREILLTARETDALAGLAKSLADQGKVKEGVEVFRELLEERGEEPRVHVAFARFLLDIDPPDKRGAALHFQRAMKLGYRATPAELNRFLSR